MSVVLDAWITTTEGIVLPACVHWMEALLAVMSRAKAESEQLCLMYRFTRNPVLAERFAATCADYCRAKDLLTILGPTTADWQPQLLEVRLPPRGGPDDHIEHDF